MSCAIAAEMMAISGGLLPFWDAGEAAQQVPLDGVSPWGILGSRCVGIVLVGWGMDEEAPGL